MNGESQDKAIRGVSDTAHWVAALRAEESQRPDAVFSDPLAARLAGSRGREIVARSQPMMRGGWYVVARTKAIDDLILESVAEGCDCVINLAAGLDTRPYRLDLPASLRWIEADLPAMIDEKENALAGERPKCDLTRVAVDLSHADARGRFLDEFLSGRTAALILTEGLLMYLDEEVVRTLARDLDRPEVAWWMFDIISPVSLQAVMQGMQGQLTNAPMVFAPSNGVGYFEALGWTVLDVRTLVLEAYRLRRLPWLLHVLVNVFGTTRDPRDVENQRWSALVRLGRQAS